ncbi:unnamed protein product [Adineta steineri]|uniref:Uncharacterized protein n=1 Tax=Adineta steineri TaxID=433720 RepID=A0A819ZKR4_9BILA|nr:unnamed protein product [Adineta steineri]
MINNFANSKSISVPSVHTGCCKTEFDSTYQNDLNGVISQNEFQESINKINRRISSTKFIVMFVLVFGFCIIGTIVSFIVGLITSENFFQLVIDVSRSINSELITTKSPSWIVGHHDNNAPPPYSSLSMGFCSQCGITRSSHSSNFCSSYGHSFVNVKVSN